MKVKLLAIVLLAATAGAVALNTFFLTQRIDRITAAVNALDFDTPPYIALGDANACFEKFKKEENYLSLTVNHNDLTDIEGLFSEMIGYLSIEDAENAKVAKSRLIDALSHLGRLSGINISSVF